MCFSFISNWNPTPLKCWDKGFFPHLIFPSFFRFYFIIIIIIFLFLLCNIVLVLPYINMNLPRCTHAPHPEPPSPYHPSGSSLCTSPEHPVSCIESGLAIRFAYDIYTCFNAILPNHPTLALSHRVQKTVLYICVSFAVSHTGLSLPSF